MAILRPAGDFDKSYEQDMSVLRKGWQIGLLIISLIALYTVPLWASNEWLPAINRIAYTVVALQGLNLLTGYAGQISLGQAAFMLVGGYSAGLIAAHLGWPVYLSIPAAALITGIVGLIFGLPSLRVKGFYLAMATLAAQFIIPWLARQPWKIQVPWLEEGKLFGDYLGGTEGFIKVPTVQLAGIDFGELSNFVLISITVMLITTIITLNISRTKLGRAFVAVRDNDLAAELLGVNLFGYKLRAFFLAALYAGIAGSLRAYSQHGVGTELGYQLDESVLFLGMIVIGGLGTNIGPFVGAGFVIILEEFALNMGEQLAVTFPDYAAQLLSSFRPIIFGSVLVLFLIFEPRGIAHRWSLIKAAWRLRPFSR